jgi:hypothetical protein
VAVKINDGYAVRRCGPAAVACAAPRSITSPPVWITWTGWVRGVGADGQRQFRLARLPVGDGDPAVAQVDVVEF